LALSSQEKGEGKGCSFLKKRTKKLLIILASASPDTASPKSQKFFASFFQKRSPFFSKARG
jgi:hypothetical protein